MEINQKIFGISNQQPTTFKEADLIKAGDVIPVQASEDLEKIAGNGVIIDSQNKILKAESDGYLRISDEKVFIDKLEVIETNITLNTPTKNYFSSLWIKGDVFSGSELNVAGNLQIDGTVENASITCHGNIIINGNIFGQDKSKITAKGSILANSITGSKLFSFGQIVVKDFVRHSKLYSKKSIIVEGRGEITGGLIYAKDSLIAKKVGCKNVIKTLVYLGYNFKQKARFDHLKNSFKKIKLSFLKNKTSLEHHFQNVKFKNEDDYIDFIMKNIDSNDYFLYLLKSLENIKFSEQLRILQKKIKNFSMDKIANIDAFLQADHIFPGVTIRILDKKLDIIEEISGNISINRRNIEKWQQL